LNGDQRARAGRVAHVRANRADAVEHDAGLAHRLPRPEVEPLGEELHGVEAAHRVAEEQPVRRRELCLDGGPPELRDGAGGQIGREGDVRL
jgi:hypothetical protein